MIACRTPWLSHFLHTGFVHPDFHECHAKPILTSSGFQPCSLDKPLSPSFYLAALTFGHAFLPVHVSCVFQIAQREIALRTAFPHHVPRDVSSQDVSGRRDYFHSLLGPRDYRNALKPFFSRRYVPFLTAAKPLPFGALLCPTMREHDQADCHQHVPAHMAAQT